MSLSPGVAAAGGKLSTVAKFDPSLGELPESITTDADGNIYASMGAHIKRITPWGHVSVFATLPLPPGVLAAGLKFGEDGDLFVATGSISPVPPVAFVFRVDPDGGVTTHATLDPTGYPNDLAFDDHGGLFVTDPLHARIWKIDEDGTPEVWLQDAAFAGNEDDPYLVLSHFGVDGIAFDRHKNHLFVSNLDYGTILRVEVECDGSPGDIDVWADDYDALAGADGLAFDDKGTLFVAVNGQDRLVAIDKHGDIDIIAEGGLLDAPSSLVFGATHASKKTLYVASFAITRHYGIFPGTPKPALLKLPVKHKGLPLL
ncbi:SMP-30/gluconolactonase/LRE family protein [Nannocystis bainbridge]|uniref:SMP-30/gluconolactonase/LRE family protein n=1 Tax=Nannocystis bainbridge TaxID=2995303 RepID=A0ABT5E3L5_9BACT|nr:SMP-30/gluconolactonase/LRE family protein [Nannocystis bainbridge]MDC0720457.1 SMP-30/gluconolactonase/LRE family protein [Nannocystis bainbridge]